jgi:hypothetical protein
MQYAVRIREIASAVQSHVQFSQLTAPAQLIDGYLRHVFAIHLDNLYHSWRELYKVKEEERKARAPKRQRKSVRTIFMTLNEQKLLQLPIR